MPALGGKCLHLRAPHQADLRPAMEEQDERSTGRSALQVVRCVARRAERVRDQREGHAACYTCSRHIDTCHGTPCFALELRFYKSVRRRKKAAMASAALAG